MVVLEIDAGNTFVKWRMRCQGQSQAVQRWLTQDVREGRVLLPEDWFGVQQVRWVSVAGDEVDGWLQAAFQALAVPVVRAVARGQQSGLKNAYQNPQQMGADRWLAMLAVWQQLQDAFCVIDVGSAVTVDLVDRQGQHLGGYILPGLRLLQQSLLGQTAGVRWQTAETDESLVPGDSTAACVENGCRYQMAALLQYVEQDCRERNILHIWLTGGDASRVASWCPQAMLQETLVLDGLQCLEQDLCGAG